MFSVALLLLGDCPWTETLTTCFLYMYKVWPAHTASLCDSAATFDLDCMCRKWMNVHYHFAPWWLHSHWFSWKLLGGVNVPALVHITGRVYHCPMGLHNHVKRHRSQTLFLSTFLKMNHNVISVKHMLRKLHFNKNASWKCMFLMIKKAEITMPRLHHFLLQIFSK